MAILNIFFQKAIAKHQLLVSKEVSLKEFSTGLEDLTGNIKKGLILEIASSMTELHHNIVEATPVDTGLAQSNWQIDEDRNNNILNKNIIEEKTKRKFYEKGLRIVEAYKTPNPIKFMGSSKIVIFNNLDYIDRLRAGSSPQAQPGQMVEDNVTKHKIDLEKNLKKTGLFK